MNQIIFLSILMIVGGQAFARGGSSTVGPAGPKIISKCENLTKNVYITISKMPPKYKSPEIGIQTVVPMNLYFDKNVVYRPGKMPGAPAKYIGERFTVVIANTSPIGRKGGKIFYKGHVSDSESWESDRQLELTCW